MRKFKKLAFLFLLIILLVPVLLTEVHKIKKNQIYEYCKLPENTKNYYYTLSTGTLLVGLENGDIWEIKEGNKYISSDIQYVSELSSYCSSFFLIKNNGDVYSIENGDYLGNKIGRIPGAVSGIKCSSFHEEYMMLITEDGELYVNGSNQYGVLGLGDIKYAEGFIKIVGIPKVKKVVSGRTGTLVLTVDGDIYYTGGYREKSQNIFTKCKTDVRFTDILCGAWDVYALDEDGGVYTSNIIVQEEKIIFDFTGKKIYEDIVSMKASDHFSVFLNNTGKVYYTGTYFHGKASEQFEGKPFIFEGVEDIMLFNNELYLIKDGVVYLKNLSR